MPPAADAAAVDALGTPIAATMPTVNATTEPALEPPSAVLAHEPLIFLGIDDDPVIRLIQARSHWG